jgi:hypothetical protein
LKLTFLACSDVVVVAAAVAGARAVVWIPVNAVEDAAASKASSAEESAILITGRFDGTMRSPERKLGQSEHAVCKPYAVMISGGGRWRRCREEISFD